MPPWLLDRTLFWNQAHLLRVLREYEAHHDQHRPYRSLHCTAHLRRGDRPRRARGALVLRPGGGANYPMRDAGSLGGLQDTGRRIDADVPACSMPL
jgi:hypothetical protein